VLIGSNYVSPAVWRGFIFLILKVDGLFRQVVGWGFLSVPYLGRLPISRKFTIIFGLFVFNPACMAGVNYRCPALSKGRADMKELDNYE
jgi:hypothetical protein